MDAVGGWHVSGVGGRARGAARGSAWPLAADGGQDGEGAPRLPAVGRGSCCGRSALYPLWGEHSGSGPAQGRPGSTVVPPAHATRIRGPLSPLPCAGKVPHPIPHGATQHRHATQGQGWGTGW